MIIQLEYWGTVMATKKVDWEKLVQPPTKWERFCIWFYWSIGRNIVDIVFYSAMMIVLFVCVYEFTIGIIEYQTAREACMVRGGIYSSPLCLDPKALK